ncbi:DNA replication and repair protein recF [Deinococcus proteolyticus MRP]|uniref:DNA replication and repair protein RecF n=1 Tax=Deinococcus proteolyticus (strain ATCC 35074 / DSM 20540 / JCM 6276 / NBRC 101906 / NCIMB 13154 / VKM Ac-1939 / CCM 2703 / MRP) TaxID=693977 RepID=F0RMZ2_DEIPM|nr:MULTISPECIES: DNA replication and repair protein RecF [Deinococcus]ADY26134.1 DNA replication and repair protein recF [Deinococcus proteolyticus MRP]MCY1702254.1 DNA replication and repair protein RecF [Deinococcus sp. SL84]
MAPVRLSKLSTLNYRNLAPDTLEFPAGVTGVWGENGAGKTNLLEAAYLALTGRTEAGRLEELVLAGQAEAYVRADVLEGGSLSVQEVGIGRGRRQLKVDGVRTRTGDLPRGSAVLIRPEDSELVFGSPSQRRAYLDSLLGRLSARYAEQLSRYERTVSQRNAALREGQDWALDVWDAPLVTLGRDIMEFRARALVRLEELARHANAELGSRKALDIRLLESTDPASYAQTLHARRAEELARGVTLTGPHRDDLELTLGGLNAGTYASRGEGRTAALSLRYAELQLLSERFGEPPVLLIDDWTAELDPQRRQFLLDLAASVPQAIVTGTEQPPGAQLALQAAAGRFTPQPQRQEEMPA